MRKKRVLAEEITEFRGEIAELNIQRQQLQKEIFDFGAERKTLVEQKKSLKEKNEKITNRINAFKEKNKTLEQQLDHAIEFYNAYVDQLISMKQRGDQFQLDVVMDKYNEYGGFDIEKNWKSR